MTAYLGALVTLIWAVGCGSLIALMAFAANTWHREGFDLEDLLIILGCVALLVFLLPLMAVLPW